MQIDKSKSGLFLMELIVATLVLAVTSIICIRIFLSAKMLSNKSTVLTNAVIETRNTAELITGAGGKLDKVCKFYSVEENNGSVEIYFNKEFNLCKKDEGIYLIKINSEYDKNFVVSDIIYSEAKNKTEIYSLNLKTYKGEE